MADARPADVSNANTDLSTDALVVDVDVDVDVRTDGWADAVGAGPHPDPRFIPRPTGPCPAFAPGMLTFRAGALSRQARIWMSPEAARGQDGPLLFYWYGTNGSPGQAIEGLGNDTINAVVQQGGLVVAPVHDPAAGIFPWFLTSGSLDNDLRVADEILACAIQQMGVDLRRIHAVGFSAGAMHTAQMSYRRSGYLASVVTYSGAKAPAIPDQDPSNKLAALILHGGPNDRVVISFQMGSEGYRAELLRDGRFAILCDHGTGHRIPPAALPSAWQFLQAHPFGISPFPFARAVPAGFPPYCRL